MSHLLRCTKVLLLCIYLTVPISILPLAQGRNRDRQPTREVAGGELHSSNILIGDQYYERRSSRQQQQHERNSVYLESMEDLEHVTYLAMRNFNLTDEGLLQSSWLMGLGNALAHKQYQKTPTAGLAELSASEIRDRLALMLESFISHLRNGHLRRLTLEELEAIVVALNQTASAQADPSAQPLPSLSTNFNADAPTEKPQNLVDNRIIQSKEIASDGWLAKQSALSSDQDAQARVGMEDVAEAVSEQRPVSRSRCHHLVAIYKFELLERQKQQLQRQQHSRASVEYDSSHMATSGEREQLAPSGNGTEPEGANGEQSNLLDERRLMQLCQLAVKCHSAEELVDLISGTWNPPASTFSMQQDSPASESITSDGVKTKRSLPRDMTIDAKFSRPKSSQASFASKNMDERPQRKSLRDSLSLSIAKLCPLILFPLHEEDGLCSIRRDDRPPPITVWGFATLFVTIVSFCSLVGLSITPFLGQTGADSSVGSDASGTLPANANEPNLADFGPAVVARGADTSQQHRACLTLFEGLAVGSLVGSALFSLIPQAFELQERESNQGFLLKALIIFFGIYLFFLSERLMRIILDTRQQRKKKKRQTHRSSNSIPLPSMTTDFYHQQLQQQQQLLSHSTTTTPDNVRQQQILSGRKNVASSAASALNWKAVGLSGLKSVKQQPMGLSRGKASKEKRQAITDQHIKIGNQTTSDPTGVLSSPRNYRNKQVEKQRQRQLDESGTKVQLSKAAPKRSISSTSNTTSDRNRRRKARHKLQATKRQRNRKSTFQPKLQPRDSESDDSSSSSISVPSVVAKLSSGLPGSLKASGRLRPAPNSMADESLVYMTSSAEDNNSDDDNEDEDDENDDQDGDDDEDGQQVRAVERYLRQFCSTAKFNRHETSVASEAQKAPTNISRHHHQQQQYQRHHRHQLHQQNLPNQRTSFQFMSLPYEQPDTPLGRVSIPERTVREEKQDISTVAWMIVLGDGLHNFIDGISIGAAFSESILSGVSISVAVICEEFPHELGDFAVLVSSGMTVRQALGYNFLSACTCYFGMAVGIILGDVNDGASYISALAAGVFLYIALVDMMGELSATLEETSRDSIGKTLKLLLLQNVGIFIGISIIFVLSFIDF